MRVDRLAIHAVALLALSHVPLPFQSKSCIECDFDDDYGVKYLT
jgi:hypothetical protein